VRNDVVVVPKMKNKEPVKMYKSFIFILLFFPSTLLAQAPGRKMWMGAYVSEHQGACVIDSLSNTGSARELGLQSGDTLTHINQQKFQGLVSYHTILSEIRANDSIQVSYKRQSKIIHQAAKARAKDLYKPNWCALNYEWIRTGECWLRTMIYTPIKAHPSQPAILFIPGYNCNSIENFPNNYNGRLIRHWVEQGFLVMTVEKSGNGDSDHCTPCMQSDLSRDIFIYERAYEALSKRPGINPHQLFIWGHSMGGIIAPMIQAELAPRGIMVYGTVFRPWSEFLLEMHRVQKPLLENKSFQETEDFLRVIQKIYFAFFVDKKTPEELSRIPAFKTWVQTELEYEPGKTDMWGRHWRFWQQLDSIDLAKAWHQVRGDVLVMHGGSDYIQCSALEPYLITQTVNADQTNQATYQFIPDMDHLLLRSKDFQEAITHFNQKAFLSQEIHPELLRITSSWMKERCKK
jgi:pimeloyl-ACP methyl ester carboxylesterase